MRLVSEDAVFNSPDQDPLAGCPVCAASVADSPSAAKNMMMRANIVTPL
jgi:hypothetical protein